MEKDTRKKKRKSSRIKRIMQPQRFNFSAIFGINTTNGDIYPLYNTIVNGQYFRKNFTILRGLYFGGINIYEYVGRDFGGYFNQQTQILSLTTVY